METAEVMQNIKVGLEGTAETITTTQNAAKAMGSGSLPVFATPAMTALMEKAATELLENLLPIGWTSVGIALSISHIAATPVGKKVRAIAKVEAVEGKKIKFTVEAFDEKEKIGFGTHERFAVLTEKFLKKAESK